MIEIELKDIDPNDFDGWEELQRYAPEDPYDDSTWLTVSIGPANEEGADYFQVHVATPRAISRLKADGQRFKGLVVPAFSSREIEQTLNSEIASVHASDWPEAVRELQRTMLWEYEGM